jgi:Lipoprotein amino terminal region
MKPIVKIGLLALALSGAGAGVWAWQRQPAVAVAKVQLAPAGATLGVAPVVGQAFSPVYDVAEVRRYKLSFLSELAPLDAPEKVPLELAGDLSVTTLSADATGSELAFELAAKVVSELDEAGKSNFERGLALPFFVRLDASGRVEKLGTSKAVPSAVEAVWRSLLASLQFVGGGSGASWTAEEEDVAGKYRAQYSTSTEPRSFVKQKSEYTSLHQPANDASKVRYEIIGAHVRFKFDETRRLTFAQGHEAMKAHAEPPVPSFAAVTDFTMELRETGKADAVALAALRTAFGSAIESTLASGPDARMRRDELDKGALKDVSMLEVWRVIDRTPQGEQEIAERRRARLLLAAHLRQNPEDTSKILQRLRGERADAKELVAILREAGTAEAQQALTELSAVTASNADMRVSAALALGHVERPTPATVEHLQGLTSDTKLRNQAIYSLGSATRHLQAFDPRSSDDLVAYLVRGLDAAQTSEAAVVWLSALGSTANPRALAAIQPRLASPDADIAAAAIWALRLLKVSRADELVAAAMESPRETDRVMAVKVLAFRPASQQAVAVLAARMELDPAPTVRAAVIRETQALFAKNVPLYQALERTAKGDRDPGVREAATRALAAIAARG